MLLLLLLLLLLRLRLLDLRLLRLVRGGTELTSFFGSRAVGVRGRGRGFRLDG